MLQLEEGWRYLRHLDALNAVAVPKVPEAERDGHSVDRFALDPPDSLVLEDLICRVAEGRVLTHQTIQSQSGELDRAHT